MELTKAADIAEAYTKLNPELKMYLKGYLEGAADQKNHKTAEPVDPEDREEQEQRPA